VGRHSVRLALIEDLNTPLYAPMMGLYLWMFYPILRRSYPVPSEAYGDGSKRPGWSRVGRHSVRLALSEDLNTPLCTVLVTRIFRRIRIIRIP
jgi:hypothetical protein